MIATKVAIVLGLVVLGIACWMAVIGVGAASEGLLTVCALFVLVAGGNLVAGRSTGSRRVRAPGVAGDPTGPQGEDDGSRPVDPAGDPSAPADAATGRPDTGSGEP